MNMLPADWALVGVAVVLAVIGLFRGFSGMLAFVAASTVASMTAMFGWPYSASFQAEPWMRAGGVLIATLLAFGIVRMVVKKLVNGLLAQPSDAILGMLIGAACGALLAVVWGYSGIYTEYSNLAGSVSEYFRGAEKVMSYDNANPTGEY